MIRNTERVDMGLEKLFEFGPQGLFLLGITSQSRYKIVVGIKQPAGWSDACPKPFPGFVVSSNMNRSKEMVLLFIEGVLMEYSELQLLGQRILIFDEIMTIFQRKRVGRLRLKSTYQNSYPGLFMNSMESLGILLFLKGLAYHMVFF